MFNFNKLSTIEKKILKVNMDIEKHKEERILLSIDNDNKLNLISNEVDKKMYDVKHNKLKSKLDQLEIKRQHILDNRNGWLSRVVWSIVSPIIVSLIVNYLVN